MSVTRGRAWNTGLSLVCAALFGGVAPTLASANTLYVTPGGSDLNGCTSALEACLTVAHAVALASNDDTIQIGSGTYDEAVSTALHLTFVGAGSGGSEPTIIDSSSQGGQPALKLEGADTVEHLALTTSGTGVGGALNVSGAGEANVKDVNITTPGGGSDGIDAGGENLSVSDSTIEVTNTDANVENNSSTSLVVNDGSAIEMTHGTLALADSTLSTTEGLALRIHGTTASSAVRDSLLYSSGTVPSGYAGPNTNEWQTIELGAGTLALTFDTVVNGTVGTHNTNTTAEVGGVHAPPSDALWVAPAAGVEATIVDSVLHAQPTANALADGEDIDADENVSASYSAYTTVNAATGITVTLADLASNLPGDPGLEAPGSGNFSAGPGSRLLGAGDPAVAQGGELDLGGAARTTTCGGGSIVNIGAYETTTPTCPVPPAPGDSTGALSAVPGAGGCVTGDTQLASGCPTAGVPGLTGGSPQGIVQTADGKDVYVVAEDATHDGVDVVELARGANGLAQLPAPDNCISSSGEQQSGCGTGNVAALLYAGGAPQPASIAVSPDGHSVYVDNGSIISEFSREGTTGALKLISTADCIEIGAPDVACAMQGQDQVGRAAALEVSPDGKQLYLATRNDCSFSDPPGPGGLPNVNCNNSPPSFFAEADIAVFSRDTTTGALGVGPCYANASTPVNKCTPLGSDVLYSMTSIAFSPDSGDVYVTSNGGPNQNGYLVQPGEVDEFSRDPLTGALTPLPGAGACLTAGNAACGTGGTGTGAVPGLIDPQQIVISPDGHDAYVTSAAYVRSLTGIGVPEDIDSGLLAQSTLTQYSRDQNTGALTPIANATCFTGLHEGCLSMSGSSSHVTEVPALTGAEGLAASPEGQSVYASALDLNVDSAIVEFSRDTTGGLLTPLSSPKTCISDGAPSGASNEFACGATTLDGVRANVSDLPGGILVTPDCSEAYLLSDGIAELSRSVPVNATGCSANSGGTSTVQLSATQLSFGVADPPIGVGSNSPPQSVTIANSGTAPLSLSAAQIIGSSAGAFVLSGDECSGQILSPEASCKLTVVFKPAHIGVVSAVLQISDDAPDTGHQQVTLTGDGSGPVAKLSASLLTYGAQPTGTASANQTVTITNTGRLPLTTPSPSLAGEDASVFAIDLDTCTGAGLSPGASCAIGVIFRPSSAGTRSAQLQISDNAPDSPQAVTLGGTGVTTTVAGVIHNGSSPVAGADVYACPQGQLQSDSCVTKSSDKDGDYGLALAPGTWLLQVSPPSPLEGASATVTVSTGAAVTQDFSLAAPRALEGGMSFNGQSSGVPTFNYQAPYTLGFPLPIPPKGTPNTTRMFTGFGGLEGGGQSAQPGQQYIQMAGIIVWAHYGADGHVTTVSNPVMGSIPCANSQAATAQCALLAAIGGSPGAGSESAHAASAHASRARAHASQSGEPGVEECEKTSLPSTFTVNGQTVNTQEPSNVNVQSVTLANYQQAQAAGLVGPAPPPLVEPDKASGGFVLNVSLENGVTIPIVFGQAQIPQLEGNNPWANALINVINAGAGLTQAGLYNTVVGVINQIATAAQGGDQAAINVQNAFWQILSQGIGGKYHGAASFFWNLFSGDVSKVISPTEPTTVPTTSCKHGGASGYADPSGTIRTSTGIPLSHAKVTLERAAKPGGRLAAVKRGSIIMSPGNRRNSDFSNVLGEYGWDVLPGQYEITASHSGCSVPHHKHNKIATSKRLPVPPAQTGVNLVLNCPRLRRVAVRMSISLHVDRAPFGADRILATLRGHGSKPAGVVTFSLAGKRVGVVPVVQGVARLNLPGGLPLKGSLAARYSGDSRYKPKSQHHRL